MAQLQKLFTRNLFKVVANRMTSRRGMCTEKDLDKPVKFSSSNAATWKAAYSRSGSDPKDEAAWFQPYIVTGSVAAFLIYFCVLREESDVDKMIYVPLHNRIEGLEESQLRVALEYNVEKGLPTEDIRNRIAQIEKQNRQTN